MNVWKLVPVLALATAAAHADAPPEWGEYTREELFSTHFAEAPGADAVILHDSGEIVVDPNLNLRFRRHCRVKIFTEAGARAHAEIRVPFAEGDKIRDLRAETLVPPDRTVKADTHEEKTADGKVLVIRFKDVAPGVLLEHTYEHWSPDPSRIEPWVFQNDDFTRLSRLDVRVPKGLSFDADFGWMPGVIPQPARSVVLDEDQAGRELQQSRWTLENLPAYRDVPLLPNPFDYRTTLRVQLTAYHGPRRTVELAPGWSAIGAGIAGTWDHALADADGAGDLSAAPTGGDETARAKALFAAVRDRIATEGSGSPLAPPSLSSVIAAGRGPGFAKNLLLLKLLRDDGLAAEGILIRPVSRGAFFPKWQVPSQLEHVVVRVPLDGRTVLLDASAPGCSFGQLPADSRVTTGLAVDGKDSRVVTLEPPPVESAVLVATGARLDERGALVARTNWTLRGLPSLEARAAIARDGGSAWFLAAVGNLPGLEVDSVSVEGLDDDDAPLVVRATLRIPSFASVQDGRMESRLPFLLPAGTEELPEGERAYPIDLGCTGIRDEQVALRVPRGFRIVGAPEPAKAGAGDVSFQTTVRTEDGQVTARRRLSILSDPLDKDQAAAVRAVCAEVRKTETAAISARRSGAPSTG